MMMGEETHSLFTHLVILYSFKESVRACRICEHTPEGPLLWGTDGPSAMETNGEERVPQNWTNGILISWPVVCIGHTCWGERSHKCWDVFEKGGLPTEVHTSGSRPESSSTHLTSGCDRLLHTRRPLHPEPHGWVHPATQKCFYFLLCVPKT